MKGLAHSETRNVIECCQILQLFDEAQGIRRSLLEGELQAHSHESNLPSPTLS